MNVSGFVIWVTLLLKSSPMLGGLHWMEAQNIVLLGMIQVMLPRGGFICTAALRRLEALASNILFVIKIFAIHQGMGPAQWGITGGKSSHCNMKWIYRVGCYWIDWFNGPWNGFGHPEDTRKSRNYNCKFTKSIHIGRSSLIHINWTDRQNALNWLRRTMKLPEFAKTYGITTSCCNVFRLKDHGVLC